MDLSEIVLESYEIVRTTELISNLEDAAPTTDGAVYFPRSAD